MATLPLLPVSVIGSWSFPGWYAQFCELAAGDSLAYGTFDVEEAMKDAVRLAVDEQLRAGADLITDGEMQRVDFNLGFYDLLEGVYRLEPWRQLGAPAHDQRTRYRCTKELSAPKGLGCIEEFDYVRTITKAPIKIAVPGPFTLAGCLDGGEVYRDRQEITEALLPIVNRELRTLAAAGVEYLQLDEPSFACHPDKPDEFVDLIARTVDGVDAFIGLHMCFGNYRGRAVGRRSYRPLFPHLTRAPVDQLALEFASREMAEIDLAAQIPAPMGLAVGLVDVKNTWLEPPELVAERLRTTLKYIDAERVHITPDCGFSQTARHLAHPKLLTLAVGTLRVREEILRQV